MQNLIHSCNRCSAPMGRIVTLDNRERICGACIEETGGLLPVASHLNDATACGEHGAA